MVIELSEGLERGDGLGAAVDEERGVGAVECGHPWLGFAADEESVDGAAVEGWIGEVGELIFVVWGVFRVEDDEVLEGGAAHGWVEETGDGEETVADGFGFEFAAVHAPEEPVFGVGAGGVGIEV